MSNLRRRRLAAEATSEALSLMSSVTVARTVFQSGEVKVQGRTFSSVEPRNSVWHCEVVSRPGLGSSLTRTRRVGD